MSGGLDHEKCCDCRPRFEKEVKELQSSLSSAQAEVERLTNRVNLLSVSANTIHDAYDNGLNKELKEEVIRLKELQGKLVEALQTMYNLYATYMFNHHSYCADYGKHSLLANSDKCICAQRKDFKSWGKIAKEALKLAKGESNV